MRCSCKECGTYMIQADSDRLGCVCPDCGYRCTDCLGTDTVLRKEEISRFHTAGGGRLGMLLSLTEEDAALDTAEETDETWMNESLNG